MPTPLETAFLNSRIRYSRQRLLVVRVLAEATDHPTADQILERARRVDIRIGRTSVQTCLKELCQAGLAFMYEPKKGLFRFEDAMAGPHDHIVDETSGELINFCDAELNAAVDRVAADLGYRQISRVLVLHCQRSTLP